MAKLLTFQDFIDRCNEIHNFGFDYSNSDFVNTRTPLEVRCKRHDNIFMQLPKSHLKGKTSCKQCTIEKKQITTQRNYGVDNPSQSTTIKERKVATCLSNHGVEYSLQSSEIRERIKKTCLEKFGVENPNQLKIVRDKIEATCIERYGSKSPLQNEDVKEKIKATNMDVRGVEYAFQCTEVKEKIKEHHLKEFGVEYPMQSPVIREKSKLACLENFGVEYSLQAPEVREKGVATCLEKFGVENPMQNSEIKAQVEATCMERYGFKSPLQNEDVKKKIQETVMERHGVLFSSQIGMSTDSLERLDDIGYLTNQHHVLKNTLTHIAKKLNVTPKTVCDNFRRHGIEIKNFPKSQLERDVVSLIEQHTDCVVVTNTRKIIGKELDIYIPELSMAIEVNGVYYHSELFGKDRKYHVSKLDECEKRGIGLMHILENDWIFSKDIVSSLILARLKKTPTALNARQCTVCNIPASISREFFTKNHLNGYTQSSIHVGLYYDGELVSVMSFSKNRYGKGVEYEMTRFASKVYTNVRGAAGKLFKYFIREYKPKGVVSYAQRGLFTGKVYEALGFEFSHTSAPNHQYFHKSNTLKLFSRIKFQKHKLSKELEDFNPDLSAWQNMQNNGYDRIWDCGNNVYVFKG